MNIWPATDESPTQRHSGRFGYFSAAYRHVSAQPNCLSMILAPLGEEG